MAADGELVRRKAEGEVVGQNGGRGRSVLDGVENVVRENGATLYSATWRDGRKTGMETWWFADGRKIWEWEYGPDGAATWTQFWPNGNKKHVSIWKDGKCTGAAPPGITRAQSPAAISSATGNWFPDGPGARPLRRDL